MVYRVIADGIKMYAETSVIDYTTDKDREARAKITGYFKDKLGVRELTFDTSFEETERLHETADEFYYKVRELFDTVNAFPEHSWGVNEMGRLIPLLMQIYALAMKLPQLEYMEDTEYDCNYDHITRKIEFSEEYDTYWTVFDPYCKEDLYENPKDADGGLCKSALWDDLADILADLEYGVDAYKAGLVCEAIFNWRFNMIIHYGHHITDALSAMCRAWEDWNADKDAHTDPDDYWSYGTDSVIVN